MSPRKPSTRFPRPFTNLSQPNHTKAQKCGHRSCERYCGHRRRKCPRLINSQLSGGEGEEGFSFSILIFFELSIQKFSQHQDAVTHNKNSVKQDRLQTTTFVKKKKNCT